MSMLTRRSLLGAVAAAVAFRDETRALLARLDPTGVRAGDEEFWGQLRAQFDLDPTALSFNHAGLSPSPRAVREAMQRVAQLAEGNPSRVVFRDQRDALSPVRERLARLLGRHVGRRAERLADLRAVVLAARPEIAQRLGDVGEGGRVAVQQLGDAPV
ncbi:MAG: hypothetical protein KDC48_17280, partial [Planctomycetes bacterium]|nr:hypothetical protein [Planctomycetota bacterium]